MSETAVEILRVEEAPLTMIESQTRAEIDTQIATAKRYPRSVAKFRENALSLATIDVETAMSCFYGVPRAGKTIEGPSIRLAEIVASAYGNLRVVVRVIGMDDKFVTVQAIAHDLETNVAYSTEVKRRITDSRGKRYNDDMLVTTSNAACSIAARNAIYHVVPRAYVDPIYLAARRVAVGDQKTLADRRAAMLGAFQKMGITPDRVCAKVEKAGIEDIGLAELAVLIGLGTAIKESTVSVEEAFPTQIKVQAPVFSVPEQKAPEQVAAGQQDAAVTTEPEPEPAASPASTVTPEELAERAAAESGTELFDGKTKKSKATNPGE